MDDGCYNLKHSLLESLIKRVDDLININIIAMHAKARALGLITAVSAIEMSDLVELTFKHDKVITWQ
jgi:tRNA 2-thiouridine synthesizing protein B